MSIFTTNYYETKKIIKPETSFFIFPFCNLRRAKRMIEWNFGGKVFAKNRNTIDVLKYRVKKHQSLLIRKLGDSDMQLQYNKITNLKLAAKEISGIIIKPGETFSFCKLVGLPTEKKGYLMGMELSFGKARPGIGGGICQIANLLNWLVLHSPLTIVEKSQHSFDPFPDEGRVLPFGSGAAIFYNYIDYQFTNNTDKTFQINIWFTETNIEGELRCNEELEHSYHIFEKNHQFLKIENEFYRQNEIWRNVISKKTGNIVSTELMVKNFARVTYIPEDFK